MKIATILGARPQFIKASVVSAEFAKHSDIREVVVHTGQHFDANMSEVFFEELGMAKPQYNLGIHNAHRPLPSSMSPCVIAKPVCIRTPKAVSAPQVSHTA